MNKIKKPTKTKKERKNFRMSKAAIGTVLFDCIAAGREGSVSAEAFMATMLSLHDYIEDAGNMAGEDIDAGLWLSFKARVDKSAERSAAARLRWNRVRAERAAVSALAAPLEVAPVITETAQQETPAVVASAITAAQQDTPAAPADVADAATPQVAVTEVIPEEELPEEMKELKRNSPLRPYKVTEEMRRYGIISVEEKGYIRFEKEGYTGKELKKRVEEYVHEILVRRRRRQGLPDRGWW